MKKKEKVNENFATAIQIIIESEQTTLATLCKKLQIRHATMWGYVIKGSTNPSHKILVKIIRAYPQYISLIFGLDKIPRKQIKKNTPKKNS